MRPLLIPLVFLPGFALAAGSESSTPPTSTETTNECTDGQVWDLATESCMAPEESSNDDNARLNDVRELAYDGQFQAALDVLDTLDDPTASLAQTYYGFAHRKAGRTDLAMAYYNAALASDPENLLARSYMGQGLVAKGDVVAAYAQLTEIRARGGAGSWAETALEQAITTGYSTNY